MCFKIDEVAARPTQRTVFRWLEQLDDGRLVSPHRNPKVKNGRGEKVREYTVWSLGMEKRVDCDGSAYSEHGLRAQRGLYVWLSRASADDDLGKFVSHYNASPARLVLVECSVLPVDWLYSASNENAATYRALTITAILGVFRKDNWNYLPVGYQVENV